MVIRFSALILDLDLYFTVQLLNLNQVNRTLTFCFKSIPHKVLEMKQVFRLSSDPIYHCTLLCILCVQEINKYCLNQSIRDTLMILGICLHQSMVNRNPTSIKGLS